MNMPIGVARNITIALFSLGAVLWFAADVWSLFVNADDLAAIYGLCAIISGLLAISVWRAE